MIILETSTTETAKAFVERNLEFLGEIHLVEHKRNQENIDYQTIISGSENVMIINGGLTSGYQGEGTRGLIYILKKLGVSEEKATELVEKNRDNTHTFKVDIFDVDKLLK